MKSAKAIIIVIVVGISIFIYSQYELVTQISISVIKNQFLEEKDEGLIHDIGLEFTNPSVLILTVEETNFSIIADNETIGKGKLEPFVLPPLTKSIANGTYLKNSNIISQNNAEVKINGVAKYDLFFTSIDIPFQFYPPPEQGREFIHQD